MFTNQKTNSAIQQNIVFHIDNISEDYAHTILTKS